MPRSHSSTALLVRQRITVLSRALPAAQKGDVNQLHQARVATRRLRAALSVVASGGRGRKLARDVRRLTRALGPVRELDVALLTLDELEATGDAPAAAMAKLRQVIRHERRRLQAEMRRQVARVDLDKLARRAATEASKGGHSAHQRARDPKRLADAWRRAASRAERLRAAIENAAGIYLPDRLHEVRIAVKKLRYAMELTRELSGSRATARIRTLKEVQDLLGRMNDLEVLIARIRAVQGSKAPDLRLSSDLDRLVRRLETDCRQLHGHYMASRRKVLAICDHVVAAAAGKRNGARAA